MSIKEDVQTIDQYTNYEQVTIRSIFIKAKLYFALLFICIMISFMLHTSITIQKAPFIIPGKPSWSVFYLNLVSAFGDFVGRTIVQIKDSYSPKFQIAGNCLRLIFLFTTFYIALV